MEVQREASANGPRYCEHIRMGFSREVGTPMTDEGKSVSEHSVQPILELQHRWVEALLEADIAVLDLFPMHTYVDTDDSGSPFATSSILTALKSGDLKLESITLLETRVQTYGAAAVLVGTSAPTGSFQDEPI